MDRTTLLQASLLSFLVAGGAALASEAPRGVDMTEAYARALGVEIDGAPGAEEGLVIAARPVEEEELGGMRGGYAMPGGLQVAFGFDVETRLGGRVVQRLTMPMQGLGPGGGAGAIRVQEGQSVRLVGPGAGPVTAEGVFNNGATRIMTEAGVGTIVGLVQNSRDGQIVQQRTSVQIDIAGMSRLLDAGAQRRLLENAVPQRGGWSR
jgi:hypothetical protein